MPVISFFYGIIVRMYNEGLTKHHEPHIHVQYGDEHAVITFDGEVIEGSIPQKKLKMVQVWMDIHQEDLIADWKLAVDNEHVFRIDPLK